MSVSGILILIAVLAFVMAMFNMPAKINLVALGLALLALAQLIG